MHHGPCLRRLPAQLNFAKARGYPKVHLLGSGAVGPEGGQRVCLSTVDFSVHPGTQRMSLPTAYIVEGREKELVGLD